MNRSTGRGVLLAALLGLVSLRAEAKPWKSIQPGQSTGAEVVKRFGEPSRRMPAGKGEVLAYKDDEAIEGSREAQFDVDARGVVIQVTVFPDAVMDQATAEASFGEECGKAPAGKPCHVKKVTDDDFKPYDFYESQGLAVFFDKRGKVGSLLYLPPAKVRAVPKPAEPPVAAPTKPADPPIPPIPPQGKPPKPPPGT